MYAVSLVEEVKVKAILEYWNKAKVNGNQAKPLVLFST